LQYPRSTFNNGPLLIYLTARDNSRGEEALKAIHSDSKLREAKVLATDGGVVSVQYHHLDIADAESIKGFADFLKKEHSQGIDFVINNAGIAMTGFGAFLLSSSISVEFS
jgi:carbonyl reductase 1